jgi:hypothetical protein
LGWNPPFRDWFFDTTRHDRSEYECRIVGESSLDVLILNCPGEPAGTERQMNFVPAPRNSAESQFLANGVGIARAILGLPV